MADRPGDLVRVLVGPDQREFVVHRRLLCATSAFFRESLEAVPEGLAPSPLSLPSSSSSSSSSSPSSSSSSSSPSPLVIWLAGESAGMFELFVLWLYRGHAFRTVIDEAMTVLAAACPEDEDIRLLPLPPPGSASSSFSPSSTSSLSPSSAPPPSPARACSDLHWHLVHAHLFAARADIPALQDAAMDALQDLYLRFDWEATPRLVRFLYGDCEDDPFAACRLRKWAVALLAWTLSNRRHEEVETLRRLLEDFPPLRADFDAHIDKMAASTADVRIKNPQLRIPSNHLRRDDRHFGFRQCSFHSHRRSVGQGRCPHSLVLRARQRSQSQSQSQSHSQAQVQHPGYQHQHQHQQHHHHYHSRSSSSTHGRLDASVFAATASPTSSLASSSASASLPSSAVTSPLSCSSLTSSRSSATSEPRLVDLPIWSPLSVTTPGLAPLGMESTI